MPRTSDKRERLIDAAQALLHRQGYNQTTLLHIADESGVPLGNVYYYFKTKEDIAAAVIENRRLEFAHHYQQWDLEFSDPLRRLKALIEFARSIAEQVTDNGCPVGSLCQELSKEHNHLSQLSGEVLAEQVRWVESQFESLQITDAENLAQEFVSRLQGSILLANSLKNTAVLKNQLQTMESWLLQVASTD